MAGQLLTAMSIIDAFGNEVSLMDEPNRKITGASGLLGITSREVVSARSGRSGSNNRTRYRDDKAVVINGLLIGGDADDTFFHYNSIGGAFADAVDTNCLLKWTAGYSLELQQLVRLTSLEGPLTPNADVINYQVALRGASNVYSQVPQTAVSRPMGSGAVGGMVFPMTFPFTFASPQTTRVRYTNNGFISTPPIFDLFGYLVNPIVQLDPTHRMVFSGTVAAGDKLTIDVDARTVLLNGSINRRYMMTTAQSQWFHLPRGSGNIELLATSFDTDASLQVTWRDAYS